jgi:hypothetical protein
MTGVDDETDATATPKSAECRRLNISQSGKPQSISSVVNSNNNKNNNNNNKNHKVVQS